MFFFQNVKTPAIAKEAFTQCFSIRLNFYYVQLLCISHSVGLSCELELSRCAMKFLNSPFGKVAKIEFHFVSGVVSVCTDKSWNVSCYRSNLHACRYLCGRDLNQLQKTENLVCVTEVNVNCWFCSDAYETIEDVPKVRDAWSSRPQTRYVYREKCDYSRTHLPVSCYTVMWNSHFAWFSLSVLRFVLQSVLLIARFKCLQHKLFYITCICVTGALPLPLKFHISKHVNDTVMGKIIHTSDIRFVIIEDYVPRFWLA